jgi:hypothetical protein
MAKLGYPKAFAYVFFGFGYLSLVIDVLNGTPDPPLAFLFGHHLASLFEKIVFVVILSGSSMPRRTWTWKASDARTNLSVASVYACGNCCALS